MRPPAPKALSCVGKGTDKSMFYLAKCLTATHCFHAVSLKRDTKRYLFSTQITEPQCQHPLVQTPYKTPSFSLSRCTDPDSQSQSCHPRNVRPNTAGSKPLSAASVVAKGYWCLGASISIVLPSPLRKFGTRRVLVPSHVVSLTDHNDGMFTCSSPPRLSIHLIMSSNSP